MNLQEMAVLNGCIKPQAAANISENWVSDQSVPDPQKTFHLLANYLPGPVGQMWNLKLVISDRWRALRGQ